VCIVKSSAVGGVCLSIYAHFVQSHTKQSQGREANLSEAQEVPLLLLPSPALKRTYLAQSQCRHVRLFLLLPRLLLRLVQVFKTQEKSIRLKEEGLEKEL